ncbi:MAG: pitrilysin family protein [bacterium]|nr:pitrilysin family protein [bacterium]MDZ4231447.1 pitrilysin family protein [Patescibacteria group bacterium]
MMEFHKTVLDNGLRVVVSPQKDNPAVTVLVLVEAGSKYEDKKINGISHFLEHMCFKGTKRRPTALQISTELDGIGALYNAFTGHEYTGYYAKVDKSHFDKALDVVSDIYLNQVFDQAEIDKERGPVTEEINLTADTPMRKVMDNFVTLLYGDQPAGMTILGPKENITSLSRADFVKYRSEHYVPSATVVVISGAVDKDEALDKVKGIFSVMENTPKKAKLAVKEKQSGPKLHAEQKALDQTHLVMGVRAYDRFDDRRYALGVLTTALGGGMSSRLFHRVREQMGLAYYVSAEADLYTDHGYLMARAGVGNDKLLDAVGAIAGEFGRLKDEPLSEQELKKVKDYMVGKLMLGLETSDELAFFYGEQELLDKELTKPDQLSEKIKAVSALEVWEVAQDIFEDENLNLALIGPHEDEAALRAALKID